ncbi:MAG: hypothetical protein HZA66_13420 [Rhodopseudomonas palustris]|uniref:Uncharacterized protein n=1 Tax=Rhodopseudomonas palustris TaxID=1076 RepID=A0A933RYC3_RHOPL|nr:hypothetical protein [Rhodopseudomonas palustris]
MRAPALLSLAILVAATAAGVSAAEADCVLGSAFTLQREFSLPVNSSCRISKGQIAGRELLSVRITMRPKLGRFGTASVSQMAYQAGSRPGDDYFEYISTEIINGARKEFRVRNVVHITAR